MKRHEVSFEFAEFIPREPSEGVLYISIPYATAVHLCACGCGNKVATPLHPAQWSLTYDGESVSLNPSIGNWQLPCRSHYWIRRNQVRWAGRWSEEAIATGRRKDSQDLEEYFDDRSDPGRNALAVRTKQEKPSVLRRLLHFLRLD